MGLQRQRVPRLPGRDLGPERRPLPPAGGGGGARAGRAADARDQPVLHRTGAPALGAIGGELAGREGVPVQLGGRGQRGGDQARAPGSATRQRGVLQDGFHGRTYGALSATPQESKQAPFAPLVPGFVVVPKDPQALAAAVDSDTAAVLLEPIQGETGIHVLSEELLVAAREACDRTGAALVFDEIQTGMGRTGTLWAYERTPVVPDALTSAKALGGGLPIGALVTGERLADVFQPGDHGSTFAGGPVIASAALVALEICSDQPLLERVRGLGERLAAGLERLPFVSVVRGRGLMLAVDLLEGLSAPDLARRALLEQRLVLNATGPGTIRFLPPLVVSEQEIDDALVRLSALG